MPRSCLRQTYVISKGPSLFNCVWCLLRSQRIRVLSTPCLIGRGPRCKRVANHVYQNLLARLLHYITCSSQRKRRALPCHFGGLRAHKLPLTRLHTHDEWCWQRCVGSRNVCKDYTCDYSIARNPTRVIKSSTRSKACGCTLKSNEKTTGCDSHGK
jgi:hypothetical protein